MRNSNRERERVGKEGERKREEANKRETERRRGGKKRGKKREVERERMSVKETGRHGERGRENDRDYGGD